MTPLEKVFDEELPRLLAAAEPKASSSRALVAFASTDGPEHGYWLVSLAERTVRRGSEQDKPDVIVEGDARVLALLFSGALDVMAALKKGVLVVHGDAAPLLELARLVGARA